MASTWQRWSAIGLTATAGCAPQDQRATEEPRFNPATLVATVDHPHLPIRPGVTTTVETSSGDGLRRTSHSSHFTQEIGGIDCRWVIVREFRGEEMVAERHEYVAQDVEGHVWLLGVDATQYVNGGIAGREGTFRIDPEREPAALLLPAAPRAGDRFDRRIDGVDVRCLVAGTAVRGHGGPLGTLDGCLRLIETPPDGFATAERLLAPGIGEIGRTEASVEWQLTALVDDSAPPIDPARFAATIDHPLLPFRPGMAWRYEGISDEGRLELWIGVTDERRTIAGVDCTTVVVREWVGGQLAEEARDWFAQDLDGNVWYFGTEETEYEDGVPTGEGEAWLAGEAGATAGLEMPAVPRVGDSFRQENAPGISEDLARVEAVGVAVRSQLGMFHGAVELLEENGLEPDSASEFKVYAPGVGMVVERDDDGSEWLGLSEVWFYGAQLLISSDRGTAGLPQVPAPLALR